MSAGSSTQPTLNDHSFTSNPSNDSNVPEDANKVEQPKQIPLNILASHQDINIDQQFILKLTKDSKNVSKEVKNFCKILQFSSEWSFEEVLATIDGLDPKDYPQLFIFVVELSNFEFLKSPVSENQPKRKQKNRKVKKIKKALSKFSSSRPLLFQLTSVEANVTKIRYKDESSPDYVALDEQKSNFWEAKNFQAFLWDFLDGKFEEFEDFEDEFKKLLPDVNKSSLLLKFFTTLNLTDAIFDSIVLEVSKKGTMAEFLAALDAPFDDNMAMLRNSVEIYLSNVISDDEDQEDPANDPSVLLTAVQHQNTEISDYLITFWTHLIQQLSIEHQVRVSTAALETNQLDILCDLLDIADFPFPKDFKTDGSDQKLSKVINERQELADAIKAGNHPDIKQFIDKNPSIRNAYNSANKSALQQAIDAKNYKVYFYLKSYGFKDSEFDDLEDVLTADELKAAIPPENQQRRQNVNEALTEDQKSVNLLCNRSFIHNRRINKEQEVEYRKQIRHWYEDINKIKFGDLFLDVAASCDDLKIIFDFNNFSTENVSLQSSGTQGSMFPSSKWIFVGAKLTDSDNKPRNQKIKGVLAHELCHYVMKLVYENQENPYYKIMVKIAEMFEEIAKTINKWSTGGPNIPDDECNGIISTVFRLYLVNDFHPELIVRVVQILAEFDDDQDKSQHLQARYKILFDFWVNHVIPDLTKFNLKSRESVRKINRLLELLKCLKSKSYTFNSPKEIKTLFDNELTIVTTNVPTLLLEDILNYLQDTVGDLLDAKNIFVDPEKLKNEEILRDFKELLKDNPNLNVIVDCSSGIPKVVDNLRGLKTILVVSTKANGNEQVNSLGDSKNQDFSYSWSDLTTKCQEVLINIKVNFQNRTGLTLLKLLMPENSLKEQKFSDAYKNAKRRVLSDFSEFIDDQLLNLLVNGSDIIIDVSAEDADVQEGNNFTSTFIQRIFRKKEQETMQEDSNVLQDQLLLDVQDKPVVLISDIAGNGKSWVMKNLASSFRQNGAVKWVTFVDLKQFIDKFKAQMTHKVEPEFADFMAEIILKPRQRFEAKIFQKLYKIGKVLIFFDGFDEIAPDCAEFVSKLAQNFQQNGGNQLWISTRDYFEVDLRKMLNTDAVYGLADLTFDDAVNLIAKRWMENDNKYTSEKHVSNKNEKYKNYRENAQKIVQKFHRNRISTVGMPLLMKMIAETSIANKDFSDIDVTIIFKNYIEKLIKIWSLERGKISSEASLKCQEFEYGSWKIHHYWAIATLFPEFAKILFPDYDPSEWTDLLIVACGLINKNGEKVFFVHETYREFFVADYLAKALKKPKIGDVALKVLTKVFVEDNLNVIRMFLNGLVDDLSNLRKFKNFNEIFKEEGFENFFIEMFDKNLDKFSDFFIESFKSLSYKEKLELLNKTARKIAKNLNDLKSLEKFQKIIFENNLTTQDLKNLILDQGILQSIIGSSIEFENFLSKAESKTDREFIKKALTGTSNISFRNSNIFYHLCWSTNLSLQKFQKTLKVCQNFLEFNEICGLFRNCNQRKESVLFVLSKSHSQNQLCQIWQEIENFYEIHDASDQFKELIKQKNSIETTVLSYLCYNSDIEFHKNLWEVMLNTFEDREELKEFIINNKQRNFIHSIVTENSNLEVVKLTFDALKQNFTDAQFTEIIKSKSYFGFNLLLKAFKSLECIGTPKFLWTFLKDFCGSDEEFLKMVQEVDEYEGNVIQICVNFSTKEIFEFLIEELEKLTTRDEIRKMLSQLNHWGTNIIQTSARFNKSPELHESVWKVFRKYFEASEIVSFIKHVDKRNGENLLFCEFTDNKLQMVELTWNKIKKYLSPDEQVQYLKIKNKKGFNLLERAKNVEFLDDIKREKVEWIIKTFKEYKIDFTDEQLPSWYLQGFNSQREQKEKNKTRKYVHINVPQ